MICADCIHWSPGEFWSSGNGKHSTIVECKGLCKAKKNYRKRWNYSPAYNCCMFKKKKQRGLIMSGVGTMTDEQMLRLHDFLEENIKDWYGEQEDDNCRIACDGGVSANN